MMSSKLWRLFQGDQTDQQTAELEATHANTVAHSFTACNPRLSSNHAKADAM